jgi:pre-mRNA-splicing factor 38A
MWQAVGLRAAGGTFGGARKPCEFMCLTLKLLQIQPDKDIIIEYIKNDEFKYVRMLGEFLCAIWWLVRWVCPANGAHCHEYTATAELRWTLRMLTPSLAGAFYLRLVGKPLDVYNYLEPLLSDFRKVIPRRPPDGMV